MNRFHITLQLDGYWRVGTGRGEPGGADSMVLRDEAGLPSIGGRTVKGLLRHSCLELERLGHIAAGTADRLFGKSGASDGGMGRFESLPGLLRFGSARMPTDWQLWARTAGPDEVDQLARRLSATALEDGRARSGSLRSFEAALPCSLRSTVESTTPLSSTDLDALRLAARALRQLGSGRTRGFGRVRCALAEDGGAR